MFSDKLIRKIRERRGSLLSSSGKKIKRGRGSSNGCMVIEYHGSLKLMVLGDRGVGKTAICYRYIGLDEDNNSCPSPSISPKSGNKHSCSPIISPKREQCIIPAKGEQYSSCVFINGDKIDRIKQYDIDIAIPNKTYWNGSVEGYKKKILESDGYILVYSKENRLSYMRLIELVSDIQKLRKCNVPPIVIVGNKIDLNQNMLQVKDSEHVVLGSFPHFDVSAFENDGIQEAFKCLVQMIAQKQILVQL